MDEENGVVGQVVYFEVNSLTEGACECADCPYDYDCGCESYD